MAIKNIRSLAELLIIREEWERVYDSSALKSPTLKYEHIKLWYECFAQPENIRVFKAMEAGQTIGYLPLVVRSRSGARVLTNLTNDHCLCGEALVRRGYEEAFKKIILDEILKEPGWDILHHIFSYSFSKIYPLFPETLLNERKNRWKMNIQPTYTVMLNKSFDEYFRKDLSSNLRKSLKQSKNRLIKAGSYRFIHFEGDEAVEKWQDFLGIEDSGWKGKNGTSILKTAPEYRKYYDGLIRILSATRDLHLYFLELDQKYVAAAFSFTAGDIFQCAKIGYDEEYQALSPATMLLMHLMEDIQGRDGEIRRIHFFPYDDTGYKKRFANEEQQFSEIIIYNNTLRGQSLYMLENLKNEIIKHPSLKRIINKIYSTVK